MSKRKVHPILYGFYQFLKLLVLASFKTYFRKTYIKNKEGFDFSGPTILVCNHPNTLLDPLAVACRAKPLVFFLANASLFKSPMGNRVFNTLYCIPIERPQDVGGKKIDNERSFERCDEFLGDGGCLFIAPEGGSKMVGFLRKIKTGTARIGLSAERKNDFKLGLKILPVGLSYEAHTDFRSALYVQVGQPIFINNYQKEYEEDAFRTAKKITKALENEMNSLLVASEDEEQEQLVQGIEEILQSDQPISFDKRVERRKRVLTYLQKIKEEGESQYNSIAKKVSDYFSKLDEEKTNDNTLRRHLNKDMNKGKRLLFMLIGFPFFLYGWINNFFANYIPALLAGKMKLYIGYKSTIKILAGIIFYPIIYGIQIFIVHKLFQNNVVTLLYFLSLIPTGLFAWRYRKEMRTLRDYNHLAKRSKTNSSLLSKLGEYRNEIVQFTKDKLKLKQEIVK